MSFGRTDQTILDEFKAGDVYLDDAKTPHLRRGAIPPANARQRGLWKRAAPWTRRGWWTDPYRPNPLTRGAARTLSEDRWWLPSLDDDPDDDYDPNPNVSEWDDVWGNAPWWDGNAWRDSGTLVRRKRVRTKDAA